MIELTHWSLLELRSVRNEIERDMDALDPRRRGFLYQADCIALVRFNSEIARRLHRCIVVPVSCWKPRLGTGIPADAMRHPPGCPDPDWCAGNRSCYWRCTDHGDE